MTALLDLTARYASPILLAVGALLAGGVILVMVGELTIGWSMYALGYVGAALAFVTIAALQRYAMGRLSWAALAVLVAGIVLTLPALFVQVGFHAGVPLLHDLFRPYAATPLGTLSGAVAWIAIAVFSIASVGRTELPRGAGVLIVAAALLVLPVELRLVRQPFWAIAMVIVFVAFAWITSSLQQRRRSHGWLAAT